MHRPTSRLVVDAGLLVIVLIALAAGRPFTLQYAREGAPQEVWDHPRFLAVNPTISLVWAVAFAVLVLADAAMIWMPEIPRRFDIIATVLALVGAYSSQRMRPNEPEAKCDRVGSRFPRW